MFLPGGNQWDILYGISVVYLYGIYLYISWIEIEIAVVIVLYNEFMRPAPGSCQYSYNEIRSQHGMGTVRNDLQCYYPSTKLLGLRLWIIGPRWLGIRIGVQKGLS
jgi:hypothetical protein